MGSGTGLFPAGTGPAAVGEGGSGAGRGVGEATVNSGVVAAPL